MKDRAPVVLFVYNRPHHTTETLRHLQINAAASASDLYIYSDGPKSHLDAANVAIVRRNLKDVKGFRNINIIESPTNRGLATSIITGVTEVISNFGRAIILEDDLITSPYFLDFMNKGLDLFAQREDIFSITGFSFEAHFMRFPRNFHREIFLNIRPMSWSWATWLNRWNETDWDVSDFESLQRSPREIREFNRGGSDLTGMLQLQMNGKIDSWYIRWVYSAYKRQMLTVYPRISLVNNIGLDGTGAHCGIDPGTTFSHREMNTERVPEIDVNLELDTRIVKAFNRAFNVRFRSKIKRSLKRALRLSI